MLARLSSIGLPLDWNSQPVQRYLRLLIIVGALMLSVAVPFKASQLHLMVILLLVPLAFAGLAVLRWPNLGLLAVVATLIIPRNGPSGANATMAMVALLLGLWLLDMMLVQRKLALVPSRPVWPLLAFVLVAGLAFGVGQLPWYPFAQPAPLGAQLGALSLFILSAGAFLLTAHWVRDTRWLKWLTWLFLALGALYLAALLLPGMGGLTVLYSTVAIGSLFWTWLVALAFSQALLNRELHPLGRLAMCGLMLITLYVAYVINGEWKSGWIPSVVAIAAIIAFRSWRLALVLALAGLALVPELSTRLIAADAYSYSTRLEAWQIMAEIVKANPILGLGPANYHSYTALFPIRGYAVEFNSHNQYVDLIAQTGLLGLFLYVWFFGAVGWLAWRLRSRVRRGFARAYVYGALGGLAGTLVAGMLGDWALPFFYNVGMSGFRTSMLAWLFLGGLVALEQMEIQAGAETCELVRRQDTIPNLRSV